MRFIFTVTIEEATLPKTLGRAGRFAALLARSDLRFSVYQEEENPKPPEGGRNEVDKPRPS